MPEMKRIKKTRVVIRPGRNREYKKSVPDLKVRMTQTEKTIQEIRSGGKSHSVHVDGGFGGHLLPD
jgi:hypothetical protein